MFCLEVGSGVCVVLLISSMLLWCYVLIGFRLCMWIFVSMFVGVVCIMFVMGVGYGVKCCFSILCGLFFVVLYLLVFGYVVV